MSSVLSEVEAKRLAANRENNEHIRKASGEVGDPRPMVGMFYLLARDHLPFGVIEEIVVEHLLIAEPGSEFTNGWIARWAQDLVDRLTPKQDMPTVVSELIEAARKMAEQSRAHVTVETRNRVMAAIEAVESAY